jgi:hypothetical protein
MKLSFVKNQSNLQIFSKNEQNIRCVIPFNKMYLLVIFELNLVEKCVSILGL